MSAPAVHARALRALTVLLALAVAVSVVHYVDNTVNYGDYPESTTLPNPSRLAVGGSWFLFTAFGLAGLRLHRRGRVRAGSLCLAAYSGSGLVGVLHYTVAGTGAFPWWRHAHIVADITCGVAIVAFAVWSVRTLPDGPASASAAL